MKINPELLSVIFDTFDIECFLVEECGTDKTRNSPGLQLRAQRL